MGNWASWGWCRDWGYIQKYQGRRTEIESLKIFFENIHNFVILYTKSTFTLKFKKMDSKKIVGWVVGLALLGVTVYVVSKTWKAGQK